jgi:hypothetical protein
VDSEENGVRNPIAKYCASDFLPGIALLQAECYEKLAAMIDETKA